MKSFTGKFSSARGWALLLALFLGAGMFAAACGDEEAPAPTTPTPTPPPPDPAPPPAPEPTGPGVPANLKVTDSTSNSITWSWDAVEDVIAYEGQFSLKADFSDPAAPIYVLAPNTSRKVENVPANTTGHFRVRSGTGSSLSDAAWSEWTEGVMGTTKAPPPAVPLSAPTGISTGSAQEDSITVTWDEVEDAESYEVQQRASGGDWADASCGGGDNSVDTTTCVAGGLTKGTEYDFRVRAIPTDTVKHATSEWAETASSLSTAGRAPSDPASGGMGELNVRWQNGGTSNNSDIVFIWDRESDATYETSILTDATDIREDNPCAGLAATAYTSQGSATSQSVPTTAPATVSGLCVRKVGSSTASFAWGVSPPEEPDVADDSLTNSGNKTTEIEWTDVSVREGFDFEIRFVADPERPERDDRIGIDLAATSRTVQNACNAGAVVEKDSGDTDLDNLSRSVSRLQPHTGYLLCMRYSNTAGESAWAVPITNDSETAYGDNASVAIEVLTLPAASPSLKYESSKSITAEGSNESLAPEWTINTRDNYEVPRKVDEAGDLGFTFKVLHSTSPDAKALKVADCAGDAPTGYGADSSFTAADTTSGITVTVADNSAFERLGYQRRVYLCAQTNNNPEGVLPVGGGAGPWAISSEFSVSKPSGLSGSVKFASTKDENSDPTTYSVVVTVGITKWNKNWSYGVKSGDNDESCTSSQTEASVETTLGNLALRSKHVVKVYADDACTAGTSVRSSTYTVPSS